MQKRISRNPVTAGLGTGMIAIASVLLGACGGGSGSAGSPLAAAAHSGTNPESGAAKRIIQLSTGAAVALFADGQVFYSPNGFNLGGGGATVAAINSGLQVVDIEPVGSGVEAVLSDGSVVYSPDGQNLGGGGKSVIAYNGGSPLMFLQPLGSGVDAVFQTASGSQAYYSPDGLNLGGGGQTTRIYAGSAGIKTIVSLGGTAVVTLFADGSAYFSPDNRNLGGGGNSISATTSTLPVTSLVQVGGGVLAGMGNGTVYLSPDGTHLDGGGKTVRVQNWDASVGNAPLEPRDSAPGAVFLDRLWVSGGFANPTNSNACYVTCSYFDLWSSVDMQGTSWNAKASFATASQPNPRDVTPVVNNGVQDPPLPTDFYDPYAPIVVWNGQLTAVGHTVWHSADGTTWSRLNGPDGVSAVPGPVPNPDEDSRILELNGNLYFLQLDSGMAYRSADPAAASWTNVGTLPGSPRCGSATFTLSGRLYLAGGGACDYSEVYNDVWSSADGVSWSKDVAAAEWSGRMWSCTASGDGVVWLIGGYTPTDWDENGSLPQVRYSANRADVWYSKDGTSWRQFKADLGSGLPDDGIFEPRHAPTCFLVNGGKTGQMLVLIGGTGGPDPNAQNARVLNSVRRLAVPSAAELP